ncbi:MAG: DNA polymerase III subunit delta [Firmicutes bacterium]|nr:DNA polymerase III subunit delta [Bacillota bacterium]MCL2255491.1 DNA polymerase III subunit delta [Bacillota bacterium]
MKFSELKKHLANDALKPAYLLSGDDEYLFLSALKFFRGTVSNFPEINISIHEGTSDVKKILEDLESAPLASPHRLVIVNGFKGDFKLFEKYLKSPNPSSVLVVCSKDIKETLKKIQPLFETVDCSRVDEKFIRAFIGKILNEYGSSIEENALRLLLDYTNHYMFAISTNIEKLALLKMNSVITLDDVKNNVPASYDFKIYELSDAIAKGEKEKISNIILSLYADKMPSSTLMSLVYSHFRRLLYCAITSGETKELGEYLGVKEFAISKYLAQSKKYSVKTLKEIVDKFHELDFNIKSGKIEADIAFELFVTMPL